MEDDLVRELLADGAPRVVAFGGGTVTSRALRHRALDHATLVTLDAEAETILARIPDLDARPLLGGAEKSPLSRIRALQEARREAYAECHARVATDGASLPDLVTRLLAEHARDRVVIPLGERTYRALLVEGAPLELAGVLADLRPSSLLVVSDTQVWEARGAALVRSLPQGVPVTHVTLPPGEENKTLRQVQAIWDAALEAKVDRDAVVLGFGGGVVGDLAGFAASTLLRGLRLVLVPTTLLAMVDASVGGKTGFDLAHGKNLVGSFHQPKAVVVDLAHLETLPPRDLVAGLAEVAKVALACDAALWRSLEENAEGLRAGSAEVLLPIVRQALLLKAGIVRDDEREAGARLLLNLGHTVGHALEAATGYARYRHGEAVAIGLVAEARMAEEHGVGVAGLAERVRALLERLGLPTLATSAELAEARPYLLLDKKRARGELRVPLVHEPGRALVTGAQEDVLAHALRVSLAR